MPRSVEMVTASHQIFIVMGVSGSGKSAVANAVSRELSAAFLDGDFLHPRANIVKMAAGEALDDGDRAPWLAAVNAAAFAMRRTNPVSIVVCSALKRHYRDRLRQDNDNLSFIYLKGRFDVIEERMRARKRHFFKPQMLVSQFETLEEPGADEQDVHAFDINQPLDKVVADILGHIRSNGSGLLRATIDQIPVNCSL